MRAVVPIMALLPLPTAFLAAVNWLGRLYMLLIVAWAIFNWFDHSRGWAHSVYLVLDSLVGPYVGLFRRFIRPIGGMDFSPLLAIIVLQIVLWLLSWLI